MSKIVFERSFSSEIFKVKPILLEALLFIKSRLPRISQNDENDIRLVFSELLYNAVIHGNKLDRKKAVYLRIEIVDNNMYCVVSDEGAGFNHKRLIESFETRDVLESEHGRGLRIAIALMDKFSFNQSGNEINFYKKVVLKSDE